MYEKMYENFAFCYQKPISSRFSSFLKSYFKPLQNLTMKYLVKILRWKVFHSAESIHLLHAQSKFMIMIGEERDAFNQASSRMVSMSRLRAYYSECGDVDIYNTECGGRVEWGQGLLITDWEAIKNIEIDTFKK